MKRRLLILACLLLTGLGLTAQNVAINTTGAAPDASAMLDIASTTGGLLVPRMTTAQRNAIPSPKDGLMIYNTDEKCFDYYNVTTTSWVSNCGGTSATSNATFTITNCSSIKANGSYVQNVNLTSSNSLSIPVTVTVAGAYTITGTNSNNYYFSTSGTFPSTGTFTITVPGTGTPAAAETDNIALKLNGVAVTGCTPTVTVTNPGSFATPVQNCLAIYTQGNTTDGEYWISDGAGGEVKTFCDMTDGGYTMLWSYSEVTASAFGNGNAIPSGAPVTLSFANGTSGAAIYGNDGQMNVPMGLYYDGVQNAVTTSGGTINYYNYRLSHAAMVNTKQSPGGVSTYKVRITNSATNMSDAWALANYMIGSPTSGYDFIVTNAVSTCTQTLVPSVGKVWNYAYDGTGTNPVYAGVTGTQGSVCPYINYPTYGTHWDCGGGGTGRLGTGTSMITAPDGTSVNMGIINNLFGYFDETQENHHFGKCGGTGGSETSFATALCDATVTPYTATAGLAPHTTINGGQGRIVQWFVK